MEQLVIDFEQFYYTNYGQGMRFEGNSSHDRQTEKELELLTADWMRLDTIKPVESVIYNANLGSYVAAMVVSCTKEGDPRTSYWIHGVIPVNRQQDGFSECLSWPLDFYQKEVLTGQDLKAVEVRRKTRYPQEVCRRFGLTGQRLVQLMYMVWQTVCGSDKPSTLYFILDKESEENYNEAARSVMSLVYDILPEQHRHQADYQAWSENDIQYMRFVFKTSSDSPWQFDLDANNENRAAGIPEEEAQVMKHLASLYENDIRKYRIAVRKLYRDETENFQDMVWRYYLENMNNGKELMLSQDTWIRCQPYLEQRARNSEDYRRLLCCCLGHIETKGKPVRFAQIVMENHITAAAALTRTDWPEYGASLTHSWKILDRLREDNPAAVQNYLEWIQQISNSYYYDFVKRGLEEGRTWLLDLYINVDIDEPQDLQLWAMNGMSYDELLRLDVKSMDVKARNLRLHILADRIRPDGALVDSVESALQLYGVIAEWYRSVMAERQDAEAEVKEETEGDYPEPEDMDILLSAIWRYEDRLEPDVRLMVCVFARYLSDMDFNKMSDSFWMRVKPEDFGILYKESRIQELFEECRHPNYNNYRLYIIYRKMAKKPYNGRWKKRDKALFTDCLDMLRGNARPAVTAIWQYWQEHEDGDIHLLYDVLQPMTEEDDLQRLLEEYAGRGRIESERVKALTHEKTEERQQKKAEADSGTISSPWIISACIGLYMGLLVNGWYMAVHLSEILDMPLLIWGGVIGIALLTAVLLVLADRLARREIKLSPAHIPWAGMWLFVNLVMSYFIGNKITAVITGVILLAVYIRLRLKKYL